MSLQERLRHLFLVDQQLRGMRARLDAATGRLQKQQGRLDQLLRQRSELTEQLKLVQAKAASLEHHTKDFDARVETLRNQMNSVKSNKEYSALLTEVSTLKNEKSKVEDQALEQMGQVDTLKGESALLDEKIIEHRKLMGVSEAEVAASRQEAGDRLTELEKQRAEAEEQVPPEARSLFKRLSAIHEGEAMAHIVEESRKNMEYSCGGCYIGLPAERINALLRRSDQIVTCPSCGRILYLDEELKSAIVPTK